MTGETIYIFTDGAARGNPGPAGWGVVLVADDDLPVRQAGLSAGEAEVVEMGGSEARATNNQMELQAVIGALAFLEKADQWSTLVTIYTDSSYVQKGMTQWLDAWVARGWKTANRKPVANKEQWQDIHDLVKTFTLKVERLPGHAGINGNERADDIATEYADDQNPDLYCGSRAEYPYDVDVPVDADVLERAHRRKGKKAHTAFCYLSLLDGVAMRHDSWSECEKRVSGASGAKFRKARSAAHEQEILSQWGVASDDVKTE